MKPNLEKIETIQNFSRPRNLKELRGNEIKLLFSSSVLLNYPKSKKPFYRQTDASDVALGAVLFQLDDSKNSLTFTYSKLRTTSNFGTRVLTCTKSTQAHTDRNFHHLP